MIWPKRFLSRLLEPAADPRQSSAYTFERQLALLEKLRKAITDTNQTRQQLETRKAEAEAMNGQLDSWASWAADHEHVDMASVAEKRRSESEAALRMLEAQLQEVKNSEQRLALLEQRLINQIEFIFSRQQSISQRYSAAETQADISRIMRDVSRDLQELESEFEQAEMQADRMVARAEWLDLTG